MNDDQLVQTLASIGARAATPDPEFSEALWRSLVRRNTRHAAPRRELLLAAALLAAASLAAALAVGSQLLRDDPLVVGPSPSRSFPPLYNVRIPPGLEPRSTVDEVAAAARQLRVPNLGLTRAGTIQGVSLLRPGVEFPGVDGMSTASSELVWGIDLVFGNGRYLAYFVSDGTLAGVGSYPPTTVASPDGTFAPLPAWSSFGLLRQRGEAIQPSLVPLLPPGTVPLAFRSHAAGGYVWAMFVRDGEPWLVRADTRTSAVTNLEQPAGTRAGSFLATPDALWLHGLAVRELDPRSGDLRQTFSAPDSSALVGIDDAGLWFARRGAGVVVDPATGAEVRSVALPAAATGEGVNFASPPAFGALWAIDSGSGVVLGLDPVSGATAATMPLPVVDAIPCVPPVPVEGNGATHLLIVRCPDAAYLIDVDAARLLPSIEPSSQAFWVGDSLWSLSASPLTESAWWWPGGLTRLDPATGEDLEVLTFDHVRASGEAAYVIGDSLWIVVGERAQPVVYGADQNPSLIRIPLAELTGGSR